MLGQPTLTFTGDDVLTIPASADFDFGTEDLTVEFWIHLNHLKNWQTPLTLGGNYAQNGLEVLVNAQGQVLMSHGAGHYHTSDAINRLTAGNWHHIAGVVEAGTQRIFVDGQLASEAPMHGPLGNAHLDSFISLEPPFYYRIAGFLADIRVTAGNARYRENFDPMALLPGAN